MTTQSRPVLLLLAASLLWSTGGLLIKWTDWTPLGIAGARSAIAAATVYFLMGRPRLTFSAVQCGAAVAYSATVILFVAATKLTTAANAIFLQYTAPIYVALLSFWFLGERVTPLDWLLTLLAVAGIGLFFMDQLSFHGLRGNLYALASGLAFAALIMLLRKQKDASPVESVLLGNLLTATICLPFMLDPPASSRTWIGILLLGVFQLGISYVLYARAIQYVRALEAMLIGIIEPVLNPVWVMLFLGERPAPWALAGGALVLSAATLRGLRTARRIPKIRNPAPD